MPSTFQGRRFAEKMRDAHLQIKSVSKIPHSYANNATKTLNCRQEVKTSGEYQAKRFYSSFTQCIETFFSWKTKTSDTSVDMPTQKKKESHNLFLFPFKGGESEDGASLPLVGI